VYDRNFVRIEETKTKHKSERQIRAVDKYLMIVANMNVKCWKIYMIDDLWVEDVVWSLNMGMGNYR
jgi:hypothetical protein